MLHYDELNVNRLDLIVFLDETIKFKLKSSNLHWSVYNVKQSEIMPQLSGRSSHCAFRKEKRINQGMLRKTLRNTTQDTGFQNRSFLGVSRLAKSCNVHPPLN